MFENDGEGVWEITQYAGNFSGWKRKSKNSFDLERFEQDVELKYEEGLTECELANLNGLLRVYDAGKQRWVKTNLS